MFVFGGYSGLISGVGADWAMAGLVGTICLGVVLLVLGVVPGVGGMRGRRCGGFGCCWCCSWLPG